MNDSIIEDSIVRFFSKALDKQDCIAAEQTGELPPQWQQAVDNGFTTLLAPEGQGGAGLGWADAFPLFHGLGYFRVPLPVAETAIANYVLGVAGHAALDGAPVVFADEVSARGVVATQAGGQVLLRGAVHRVPWARAAAWVMLGLEPGRIALCRLGTPATHVLPATDLTKLPCDSLVFEDAACELVFDNPLPGVDVPLRHLGALARAAMMTGAAEFALAESVQYALDRVQFGRPIGRNQALQQQLAHMAGQIAAARHATQLALLHVPCWRDPAGRGDPVSAACAKVLAGEAADTATSVAHQVHGALGFTYEHILNFATRRLWAWREDHGTASWWARRIGAQVAAAGGAVFWPAMTHPDLYRGVPA